MTCDTKAFCFQFYCTAIFCRDRKITYSSIARIGVETRYKGERQKQLSLGIFKQFFFIQIILPSLLSFVVVFRQFMEILASRPSSFASEHETCIHKKFTITYARFTVTHARVETTTNFNTVRPFDGSNKIVKGLSQ